MLSRTAQYAVLFAVAALLGGCRTVAGKFILPKDARPAEYEVLIERNVAMTTGENIPTATRTVAAHQRVYHSKDYPSHIVLPLIPR